MILSEKQLVVACVIGAAAGIFILLILSFVIQPQNLPVSKATALACSRSPDNAKISISGFIDAISVRDNYALITIAGSETIEAVSFDTSQIKKLGLRRLQKVEVSGQLRNYNGKPSLVISKLRLINSSSSNKGTNAPLSILGTCGCGEESG